MPIASFCIVCHPIFQYGAAISTAAHRVSLLMDSPPCAHPPSLYKTTVYNAVLFCLLSDSVCIQKLLHPMPLKLQPYGTIQIRSSYGLRASASFVLMATGFVNGRWQFSTPTESTPFDRSPKNLVQVIMSAAPIAVTNLVQIRTRGASGQMGEI